ncbi:penicillin-binding protein PBP1A [Streptococcus entericus]|uniref:penicillin-binding protein PBP1A n=1 Tax=Streptococcus entericus TaxID=155680 RepID=UPI00047585F4|nr:penicillin-binding protein PBP1A [Streptococcus entericus]
MMTIKPTVVKSLKYLAGIGLILTILGTILGSLVFAYYASTAPKLDEEHLQVTSSSLVFDNQGQLIADLGAEKRESVTADNIPLNLVNAVTAIEDHRFFKHRGVDVYRILGSIWHNLNNDSLQGGSTLDQQLIKLAYFSTESSDQTIKRKIQEIWLSLQMEKQYTKQEILTFYVNKVFMGNGNYGMLTASKAYFGKDLKDLTTAQVALLAGIPQAPSQYNPYVNPEAAQERRNIVLGQMLRYEHITQEEYDQAVATPIADGLLPLSDRPSYAPYLDNYLKQVIEEVHEKTGSDIFTSGLKVHTNVDQAIQQHLWDIYNTDEYVYFPDNDFQVASTLMDVTNGKVIAQLGSRLQDPNTSFGTNQAVMTDRDWGSTMKPITDYAPAFEYDIYHTTAHQLNDSVYNWPGTTTELNNWDKLHYGWMPVQRAIQMSRNVPAVRTLEAVGLERAKTFLSQIGINYPELYYSNAISSNTSVVDEQYGASSENMAAAYAAFANGGTYIKPQYVNKIEFSDGRVVDYTPEETRAMSEVTAYMMTDMLKTVLYTGGTGTTAYIPGLVQAGKSGTSNYTDEEYAIIEGEYGVTPDSVGLMAPDEMFVGYTPRYSMAVWTGYKNRLTPLYGNDLRIAQRVYRAMMTYLDDYSGADWEMPSGIYRSGGFLYRDGYYPQQQWFNYSSSSSSSSSSTDVSSTSTQTSTETTTDTLPTVSQAQPEASSSASGQ